MKHSLTIAVAALVSGCLCAPLVREYEMDLDECLRLHPRAPEAQECVDHVRRDWDATLRAEGCE